MTCHSFLLCLDSKCYALVLMVAKSTHFRKIIVVGEYYMCSLTFIQTLSSITPTHPPPHLLPPYHIDNEKYCISVKSLYIVICYQYTILRTKGESILPGIPFDYAFPLPVVFLFNMIQYNVEV